MVVDSGQIEVVEDADYVIFFFRGFVGYYDWFGVEVFFFLGLLVGIEKLGPGQELTFFVRLRAKNENRDAFLSLCFSFSFPLPLSFCLVS